MKTGEILKKLRKERGWNQTELGIQIGLTASGIAAIEQGRNDPSANAIVKLAKIFEVSTDYLLLGTESERTISENEQEIIEVLRKDEDMTNAMLEIAKLKKKVFSYAKSYNPQQEQRAVMS